MLEEGKLIFAYWWLPQNDDIVPEIKFPGILSFSKKEGYVLDILPNGLDSANFISHYKKVLVPFYQNIPIILGLGTSGKEISVFGAQFKRVYCDYSKHIVFGVNEVLEGMNVVSRDDKLFGAAHVRFPNLKNWICFQRINQISDKNTVFEIDMSTPPIIFREKISDQIEVGLNSFAHWQSKSYSISANEDTYFVIRGKQLSLNDIEQIILEYSQLFSFIKQKRQPPVKITLFALNSDESLELCPKYIEPEDAGEYSLIAYSDFENKIPLFFQNWHKNYDSIAPIMGHYLKSLSYDEHFDHRDFLNIAQALDGYFKRFINQRDGLNIKKYQDEITKMIEIFSEVDVIQNLHIDAALITKLRNQYSHLYIDDDMASPSIELLRKITYKCDILLTCCIMLYLGLSIPEINGCCNMSPMKYFSLACSTEFEKTQADTPVHI